MCSLSLLFAFLSLAMDVRSPYRQVVDIKITVPEDTRRYRIQMDGEFFGRATEENTVKGRQTYWVRWKGIPGGEYVIAGAAMDAQGRMTHSPPQRILVFN
jgi:hypothetical protein